MYYQKCLELRKINSQIRIDNDEIISIIRNDVLKREIIDSPESTSALDRYTKVIKKIEKKKQKDKLDTLSDLVGSTPKNQDTPAESTTIVSEDSIDVIEAKKQV